MRFLSSLCASANLRNFLTAKHLPSAKLTAGFPAQITTIKLEALSRSAHQPLTFNPFRINTLHIKYLK